jgi:hypothetical protein
MFNGLNEDRRNPNQVDNFWWDIVAKSWAKANAIIGDPGWLVERAGSLSVTPCVELNVIVLRTWTHIRPIRRT